MLVGGVVQWSVRLFLAGGLSLTGVQSTVGR